MAGNATKIASIHIHLQRSLAHLGGIALRLWFRRVFALAVHTAVALRTCFRFASFVLAGCRVAMWACVHTSIVAHSFCHSLLPAGDPKQEMI
jgi:hypothetical protein